MYLRLFYLNCNYRTNCNYIFNFCRNRTSKGFSTLQCPLSLCQLCVQSPKQMKHSSFGRALLQRPTLFKSVIRIERSQTSKSVNFNRSNAKKREKNLDKEMRKLLSLARSEKWNLSGAILLLLISSTITMAVPFALGKVLDFIYSSDKDKMRQNLNNLAALLFVVFLIGGACNFGRVYLMNISGQRITKMLREKVFNSIMKQEVAFFDKNKTGELINRLSADTSLVSQCVTMNISDGLRSFVMVVVGCSMMFYMSAELAIVSLVIVPPVVGMAIIYGRFVRKITRKVQDSLADATQVAEERISNIRTVKSFGKENQEMELYRSKMETVLNLANKEALARGLFFGMAGLSGNLVALSVLYYGGVQVASQGLSVGDLSAFLLYAAYIGVSLSGLSSFYSEMNRGLGACERLFEIIERQPDLPLSAVNVSPDVKELGGCEVKFNGAEFSYPERETPVLRGVDLILPAGKVTAVVGPSGSGKSTLAALILGLYEPSAGTITLNASPLFSYPKTVLNHCIASVPQEPVLFSGSIKENILYGAKENEEIDNEKLNTVMKEANVLDFVKSLPDGHDTMVGERGIALSGGQRQRIAIARALIGNPRILLLDEATSALDAESEHLVQEALDRIMKGRTVLTIAHRLSTIKNADQIAVLDNGKVVELGSYEDLLKMDNGIFKKLIKHQTFKTD